MFVHSLLCLYLDSLLCPDPNVDCEGQMRQCRSYPDFVAIFERCFIKTLVHGDNNESVGLDTTAELGMLSELSAASYLAGRPLGPLRNCLLASTGLVFIKRCCCGSRMGSNATEGGCARVEFEFPAFTNGHREVWYIWSCVWWGVIRVWFLFSVL